MASLLTLLPIWNAKDEETAKYYAAGIVGLIGVFVVVHWALIAVRRINKPSSLIRQNVRKIARPIIHSLDEFWLAKVRVAPRKVILALVYFGIMAALTFYDNPSAAGLLYLAGRFGWMTLLNLCLTVFLGLKNTPLSPLAGKSYDSLNALHRCVGYTTILYVVLHAITYLISMSRIDFLETVMTETSQVFGATAGLSMVLIFCTAIGPVRRRFYEFFYAVHIILVVLILISVGIHRQEIAEKSLYIVIVAAAIWVADRTLRLSRWAYFAPGNYATITPLPHDATRVVLTRSMRAQPASHAFLYIPAVRALQAHPFTMVSSEPGSFVIKARDGFTRALYDLARQNPGGKYRAAFEGPYGNVPNVHGYERVVLVAGGSGATFTVALAVEWAKKRRTPDDSSTLDFVWIFKSLGELEWFATELAILKDTPNVRLILHCTRPMHRAIETEQYHLNPDEPKDAGDAEKAETYSLATSTPSSIRRPSDETFEVRFNDSLKYGRPVLKDIIQHSVSTLSSSDRTMFVAGCGPTNLCMDIRNAVAATPPGSLPAVKLHIEEFSF